MVVEERSLSAVVMASCSFVDGPVLPPYYTLKTEAVFSYEATVTTFVVA